MEVIKSDWKLFRERLPEWQEAYMEKLCKEYIEILSSDEKGSSRFWELEKRIKSDKRRPGVIVSVSRREMTDILVGLIMDGAITISDLDGFSDEVIESVKRFTNYH